MQVKKYAEENGLNVYVAVVAAVKGTAAAARCEYAPDLLGAAAQDFSNPTAIVSAGHGHYAMVMQHCTGPATRDIFLKPTVDKLVKSGASRAVKQMLANTMVRSSP